MKKIDKIIYTLLLCLFAISASAQKNKKEEVTISAAKYDEFRDNIKLLTDSTKTLADSCASLKSIILNLQKDKEQLKAEVRNNQKELDEKKTAIGNNEALILSMKQQHTADSLTMSQNLKSMSDMQKIVDETTAKYANGRLYFKYEAKRIQSCIIDFDKIKTSSVKAKFKQLPELLNGYEKYSSQLKTLLQSAQDDPDRKARNKAEEYKIKYSGEIRRLFYYSNYYAKQNSGKWSIPYLDNIIDVSISILKKHDPGHNDPVNFNSLIEML
jgi:chromosome segregation ATPase